MGQHRWGIEAPPVEAYSRVTNSERFAPLHETATKMLERLELEFEIERKHGYGLDTELEQRCQLVRPSVSLLPRHAAAAPLVVAFSSFPGLHVRFGRWCMIAFPACGCDACDETAEGESDGLTSLVDDLTAGRFREAVRIDANDAWREWEFGSVGEHSTRQSSQLDLDYARRLIAQGDPLSHKWKPWPKRT